MTCFLPSYPAGSQKIFWVLRRYAVHRVEALFRALDLADILFRLGTGDKHLMAAAQTLQAEIHAAAQHLPLAAAAGMGLFHGQNIVDSHIHGCLLTASLRRPRTACTPARTYYPRSNSM